MKSYSIAVVGALGAVGMEMVKMLERSSIPVRLFKPLDTAENIGELVEFRDSSWAVQEAKAGKFTDIDIALFAAGSYASKSLTPIAMGEGAVVIDNSSRWRMEAEVPLVVPQINSEALRGHHGLIANPNCSTIQLAMALKPLHETFGIKRVVVSTYQAVSGSGIVGINELQSQIEQAVSGEEIRNSLYPYQIAFNVIPQIDKFLENGYSEEEWKLIIETQKIFDEEIPITATAVRVPVYRGHSESINVEFERPCEIGEVFHAFEGLEGLSLVDDLTTNEYPVPINSEGKRGVYIGRIRRDFSVKSGINIWVVSDNLLKGAALNAVQIAEKLIDMSLLNDQ
jgi:aspartate-semialdehyde dehydrogenase